MSDIFQSKALKITVLSIAGLIVIIFFFGLGVFVGTQKADFSFRWAEEYHNNFAGPRNGFLGDFPNVGSQFADANGVFGQIITINNNTLTVKDNDGDKTEKTITISDKTIIVFQRKNIKISDLKVGDNVVVIGMPDSSGQIQAQLIRLMPETDQQQQTPSPNVN